MNRFNTKLFFCLALAATLTACGGGGGGKSESQSLVVFSLEMSRALDALSASDVKVTRAVSQVVSDGSMSLGEVAPEADTQATTIRGNYSAPKGGMKDGQSYRFDLKIYYKAASYVAPGITPKGATSPVESSKETSPDDLIPTVDMIVPSATQCPSLSLAPDGSLVNQRWILLCTVSIDALYESDASYHKRIGFSIHTNEDDAIPIPEDAIDCTGHDADGDGLDNLTELDISVHPYAGDLDGDCVADGADVFPKDANEWADLDGDGVGDNADDDRDGDGLSNDEEAAFGTDPLNSDSDADGVLDETDTCPLVFSKDQTDTDSDGMGNACDTDDIIYVDGTNGDDSNDGRTPETPVKSLNKGESLAQISGKIVRVADGDYTLSSTWFLVSGVAYYGGYDAGFNASDQAGTKIESSSLKVLVTAVDTAEGTALDGFELNNTYSVEDSPIGVLVSDANLALSHNSISVTNTGHGTGVDADNSNLMLTGNTITVRGVEVVGNASGYGVRVNKVTGSFISNNIGVGNFDITRFGIACLTQGDSEIILSGNVIDVWSEEKVPTPDDPRFVYLRECDVAGTVQHNPLTPNFDGVGFVKGLLDNVLDGLF